MSLLDGYFEKDQSTGYIDYSVGSFFKDWINVPSTYPPTCVIYTHTDLTGPSTDSPCNSADYFTNNPTPPAPKVGQKEIGIKKTNGVDEIFYRRYLTEETLEESFYIYCEVTKHNILMSRKCSPRIT